MDGAVVDKEPVWVRCLVCKDKVDAGYIWNGICDQCRGMEEQMEQEETMGETGMLVGSVDYVPSFAVSLEVAAQRLADFQKFIQDQMIEDEDYGVIPGTSKPTLLKPGAEKLANIFGFAAQFEEVREVEHWDDPGFFYYSYKCRLLNKRTGQVEAECTASCNSKEDKYRWRGG